MATTCFILCGFILLGETLAETCDKFYFRKCPKDSTALEDANITLICQGRYESDTCTWQYLDSRYTSQSINLKYSKEKYTLLKKSNKDCSMVISRLTDADNTMWQCCPLFIGDSQPACTTYASVTVAKNIKTVLIYTAEKEAANGGHDTVNVVENTRTQIICEAKNARPRPLASWYYITENNTRMETNGSAMMVKKSDSEEDKQTNSLVSRIDIIRDYVTLIHSSWDYTYHNKIIECLVEYPQVSQVRRSGYAKLNITYQPKFNKTVYTVKDDKMTIKFRSNPPPVDDDIEVDVTEGKIAAGNVRCEEDFCKLPVEFTGERKPCEVNVTIRIRENTYEISCQLEENDNSGLVLGVCLGTFTLIFALLVMYICYRRRKEKPKIRHAYSEGIKQEKSSDSLTSEKGDEENELESNSSEDEITYAEVTFDKKSEEYPAPRDAESGVIYSEIKK